MSLQDYQNKIAKTKQILSMCNYANSQSEKIIQSCAQIYQSNPFFDPQIFKLSQKLIKLNDKYSQQTLLQLNGSVLANYKTKQYNIVTLLQFPQHYPNSIPIIKIKNFDPNKFVVNQFYQSCRQPDETYQIDLTEARTWYQHQDCVRMLKELSNILSQQFPFYGKPNPNNIQNNMQQFPANYSSPLSNSQSFPGQMPPPTSQQMSSPFPQNPMYQDQFQQPSNLYQEDMVQLNKKIEVETSIMYSKIAQDFENQKKSSQNLINYYLVIDEKLQKMKNLENELKENNDQIDQEIYELDKFIHQNDQFVLDEKSFTQFLNFGADSFSQQVVELTADNRAIRESLLQIENQFRKDKISFDVFIYMEKELASKEFWNRALLKKCATALHQI